MSMMLPQNDQSADKYKDTLNEMKQLLVDKVKDTSKKGVAGKKLPAL
jgi:hypothetical protein